MLSSIGLRLAVRIIPQALSATGPAFSFVSHFQTRSFLSTSRLAQPTARTPSVNSQSDSTMKKPAAKKRVTAKKKPPAETKPPVEKRKVPLKSKKVTIPHTTLPVPKAAPSPFILFFQEHLASQQKSPDMKTMTDLCRDMGANWRNLPAHEKQKYIEQAAVCRKKQKQERLDWFKTIDPKILREINRRRKIQGKTRLKDPNAPKRVPNQFVYFVTDFIKSDEAAGLPLYKEKVRRGGQLWRQMSSSQKQVYIDMRDEVLAARAHSGNHPAGN